MSIAARFAGAALSLGLLAQSLPAHADTYPSRPVRMVVTVEAGGAADATARFLAKQLSAQAKQPYVVENRPGISGMVAVQRVSNAKPDGYTLLYAADGLAMAPLLVPGQPVNIEKDITPITIVGVSPFVFAVNPKVPVKTPKELVDYIKTHPNGFKWGIGGIGVAGQLAIERFSSLAGIHALEVPYKGNGPSIVAALSGEVDGIAALPAGLKPLIDSGKLIGLGVANAQKIETLPNVPTVASFGYPGFEALSWFGVWGPKNMPADLAETVRKQVAQAIQSPDLQKEFTRIGFTLKVSDSPADFGTYFKSEIDKDSEIMKKINMKH
ncbi:MAG TPA: tripartite tricarboxylate transporter substrate binding protein [Stellaceae bacterium]|nr:tripartite tricarboxylate transporter substrate binding protein [Stellaceae bacterium]